MEIECNLVLKRKDKVVEKKIKAGLSGFAFIFYKNLIYRFLLYIFY